MGMGALLTCQRTGVARRRTSLRRPRRNARDAARSRRGSGASDSIVWGAAKAYDATFRIVEREEGGFYPEAARDQECEADQGPLQSLVWSLALIHDRHWQMSNGFMTATEAQLSASEIFFLALMPPTPEEDTF